MSHSAIHTILFIVFILQALQHISGILAALGVELPNNADSHSWLFTGIGGKPVSLVICLFFYSTGLIGYLVTAMVLKSWLIPADYLSMVAIISSVSSIGAQFFFPKAIAYKFSKITLLIVNTGTLILAILQPELFSSFCQ